jgi:hypothetical protein
MNLYRIECTVWVRGESEQAARDALHAEVQYHFGQDNDLVALESGTCDLAEENE